MEDIPDAVASRRGRERHGNSPKTPLERRLSMLIIVFVIIVAALGISLAVILRQDGKNVEDTVCTSEQCIKSANQLLSAMDPSVNPCEDFYAFACNNWEKSHPPPDHVISYNWFEVVNQKIERDLHKILEETPVDRRQGSEAVRKAAKFYRSCMDEACSDSAGFGPLAELLRKVGLPAEIPSDKTVDGFRLSTTLARTRRFVGKSVLVTYSKSIDLISKSRKNLFMIESSDSKFVDYQPLEIPPERRSDHGPVSHFLAYVIRLMGLVNDAQAPDRRVDAEDIPLIAAETARFGLHVEMMSSKAANLAYANGEVQIVQLALKNMHLVFYTNISHQRNQLDVVEYITEILQGTDTEFDMSKEEIILKNPKYLQEVARVLSETEEVTVQRYVWWMVVQRMAPYTTRQVRRLRDEAYRLENPAYLPPPRASYCAETTNHDLSTATAHALCTRRPAHTMERKHRVLKMVMEVNAVFLESISVNLLFDEETRRRTLKKLAAVGKFAGYRGDSQHVEIVDATLEGLEVDGATFLENVVLVQAFRSDEITKTIGKRTPNSETLDIILTRYNVMRTAILFSAYYNYIAVPPSLMQSPFMDRGLEVLNYGAIGSILGHKLSLAFDSEGLKYNQRGVQMEWLNQKDVAILHHRMDCFVQQYSNYTLPSGAKIDGLHTLAENLADNGGLRTAFSVYKNHVTRKGLEPKLPGLQNYTHDQLFFLAYANIWCGSEPGPEYDWVLLREKHSPPKIRVNGALHNSKKFYEAWKCPINEEEVHCDFW